MQLVDEAVVFRNRYPNTRAIVTSAPTLALSRLGSGEPFLLSAFRVGQAKMSLDGRATLRSSHDGGRTWDALPDVALGAPFGSLPAPQPNHAGFHLGASPEGTTVLMACRFFMVEPGDPQWDDDAAGVVGADCLKADARPGGGWERVTSYDFKRHARRVGDPVRTATRARRRALDLPDGAARAGVRARVASAVPRLRGVLRRRRALLGRPDRARSTTPPSESCTTTSG